MRSPESCICKISNLVCSGFRLSSLLLKNPGVRETPKLWRECNFVGCIVCVRTWQKAKKQRVTTTPAADSCWSYSCRGWSWACRGWSWAFCCAWLGSVLFTFWLLRSVMKKLLVWDTSAFNIEPLEHLWGQQVMDLERQVKRKDIEIASLKEKLPRNLNGLNVCARRKLFWLNKSQVMASFSGDRKSWSASSEGFSKWLAL